MTDALDLTITELANFEHDKNKALGTMIKQIQQELQPGIRIAITDTDITLMLRGQEDWEINFDIDDPHVELIGRSIIDAAAMLTREI